jgi:hypothetical protein
MDKVCRICLNNKSGECFRKNSATCKECNYKKQAVYRENNKETIREKNKAYYLANKESIRQKDAEYREKNIDIIRAKSRERTKQGKVKRRKKEKFCAICNEMIGSYEKYCDVCREIGNEQIKKKYAENNKEAIKERRKEYYDNNKEKIKLEIKLYRERNKDLIAKKAHDSYVKNKDKSVKYHKEYRAKNQDKIKKNRKIYEQKRKNDLNLRIRRRVRNAVYCALHRNGFEKDGSILSKLPYSINDLRLHLESLFESWMNWDNWGVYDPEVWDDNDQSTWTWQIDHIVQQKKLIYDSMDHPNFKLCWALENLRPYSAKTNIKESNRI